MRKKYGLLCLLFLSLTQLRAQENDVDTQNLLWTRYNLKLQINEKWDTLILWGLSK